MEDKLTIRVPQRRYGAGQFTDQSIAANLNYGGNKLGAGGALTLNVAQFLYGAPVVDYSSLTFSGSLGAFDGRITNLDTTRPDSFVPAAFSSSSPYSMYTSSLMHNRNVADGYASVATGTFTITSDGAGTYHVTHPTLGDSSNSDRLYNSSGGEGAIAPDTTVDLYNGSGHYVLTISFMATTSGTEWPIGVTCTFDVINPNYTDALNWADMQNTLRTNGPDTAGASTTLGFMQDTGRVQGLDPSDAMGLYDMQGMWLKGSNIDAIVYPMANISQGAVFSIGGFDAPGSYSSNTHTIATVFGGGRAVGGIDPAPQANRAVDYFTIIRGPGYVRMYGQVSDPATGEPDPNEADKDTAYFFGMMRPYETVEDYPHPMAFLGDVGYRSTGDFNDRTRPWWRTSTGRLATANSSIWSENLDGVGFGYWRLQCPFILDRNFRVGDSSLNTPAQVKAPTASPGQNTGRFFDSTQPGDQQTGYRPGQGSYNDAVRVYLTEFDNSFRGTSWDPTVGWYDAVYAFGEYAEASAPRILPITLRQYSPDNQSWTQDHIVKDSGTYTTSQRDLSWYENIGEIPGMYWVSERKRFDGSTEVLYPSGTNFSFNGRTYRMAVGYSQSSNENSAYSQVTGLTFYNHGNLLFDMNEL